MPNKHSADGREVWTTNIGVSGSSARTLVVILHAYMGRAENLGYVRDSTMEQYPESQFLIPELPLQMFSTEDPAKIALEVVLEIDRQVENRQQQGWPEFERIVLIGHSLGALLVRKVYVLACGETSGVSFEDLGPRDREQARRPWAALVSRIILLAGMNRGWSITHHLHIGTAIKLLIGSLIGNCLSFAGMKLLIFQIRRGAPFLTNLRLQWIAMQREARKAGRILPITIQLLGTVDDLVSPTDNIDLVTGRDFVYLDVPKSGHLTVIELDHTPEGRGRREVFVSALSDHVKALRRRSRTPADIAFAQSKPKVTNVIFVIHGIRDAGYWTDRIARKVGSLGDSPPKIIYASETSTYGYFPMISFLLPSRRREKVEWLMDQYVEARVLYPNAAFAYVGHSNGTYLLAKALAEYPGCQFNSVVLAGSVIRTDYDWHAAIRRGQVGAVMNYVATTDVVVAVFPGALEMLGLQDLGSAGHNGFIQAQSLKIDLPIFERSYMPGWHGAALVEENWDDIAHFIIEGRPQQTPAIALSSTRNCLVWFLGRISPLVWLVLVCVVFLIGNAIWCLSDPLAQWMRTFLLVAYGWIIWKILSRL